MEPFDKLTVKMKSHVWCIIFFSALMIFWITAFSVSGKGDNIASWLSILFAVVVIVYMLIQGHGMRNLVEEGHRLMAEKVGTTAEKVAERVDSMNKTASALLSRLEEPATKISNVESLESDKLRFNASNAKSHTLLTLYAAVQSSKFGKPILIDNLTNIINEAQKQGRLDNPTVALFFTFGLRGILLGLECFLEPHSIIPGRRTWSYEVKNLPPEFEEHISKELTRRATEPPVTPEYTDYIESAKRNIDAYFAEL